MDNRKFFRIAGIQITLEAEMPIGISERFQEFETESSLPDVTIRLQWERNADFSGFERIYEGENYTILQKGDEFLKFQYSDKTKTRISWKMRENRWNPTLYQVFICENWGGNLQAVNPLFFFELSGFLMQYQAMILHSSVISCGGKGVVFTAPSGTGKSTQAELWHRYRDAEILNGDRTIIRNQDGYLAWGSPYAGSSGIYKNVGVPLQAVVVLRQAKKNKIRKLEPKEAYLYLLSEMSVSRWDRCCIEKQSDWLLRLIQEIPVYRLDCLPDEGAVQLLEEELGGL